MSTGSAYAALLATDATRHCPLSRDRVQSGREAGTAIAEQCMRKGRYPRRFQDVSAGDCLGGSHPLPTIHLAVPLGKHLCGIGSRCRVSRLP